MPGLLSIRPGLGSASKSAKSSRSATTSAAKHAAPPARGEKERSRVVQGAAGGPPSSALGQRGVYHRVPGFSPASPHILPMPAVAAAAAVARPKQVVSGLWGRIAYGKGNGLGIALQHKQQQRVGSEVSSSGSEHEINSVCLAEMVHDFMEEDESEVGKCGRVRCNCENTSTCGDCSLSTDSEDKSSFGGELAEVLQGLVPSVSFTERAIFNLVTAAVQEWNDDVELGSDEEPSRTLLMRHVMGSLRSSGYNAAICKSRWEHAGGFPGGDYEYIDVILGHGLSFSATATTERIIIDMDFRTQFEIVRPTPQFVALLQSVPKVFVGKSDRLQQIVNILCDAAKRSLKKNGMPLPPWRKPEYIRAKWFSSYRRTTNESPTFRDSPLAGRMALGMAAGTGWDSHFPVEIGCSFHQAVDTNRKLFLGKQKPEPEGVVRGANRALAHMQHEGKDFPLGVPWEWDPPANVQGRREERKVAAGLATVLREAGMIESNTSTMVDVVGASRHQERQRSGLSREFALERA
ncbi:hypothetical protein R1sor_010177 [Riccia sorocarpa]|uniref:Uncharacterized protein n=1 Tax=Riccia sorocarpa TaxID=122646 RepID=A0ABD3I1A8_9MARC